MTSTPIAPRPSRTPWIIVGVLGCLLVCLFVALAGVGGYLFLAPNRPTTVSQVVVTAAVSAVPPTQTPIIIVVVPTSALVTTTTPALPISSTLVATTVPTVASATPTIRGTASPTPRVAATSTADFVGIPATATIPPSRVPSSPTVPPAPLPTSTADIVGIPTTAPIFATATRLPASPTAAPARSFLIAFSRDEGDRGEDKSIWMINSDGTELRKIITGGSSPTFSPNGGVMAYYHWTDGIYTYKAGATEPKKIFGETDAKYLSWSHDGRWIAFASRGGAGIDVVDPDGKNRRSIVPSASMPSWAPDDTWLALATCRGATCGIYKVTTAGGDVIPVVGESASNPAVSPDGTRILYQAKVDGVEQVFVINADGSSKKQLTSGVALHVDAQWAPDASVIFYRTPEGNNWSIWRMNPDGSNKVKLPVDNVAPVDWPFEKLAVTSR